MISLSIDPADFAPSVPDLDLSSSLGLAAPEFYVASAISFYKALKVYPAPQELIMIYQKTQPPAVFDLVMELISLEMSSTGTSGSASSRDPRDAPASEALLTEIDDVVSSSGASASAAPSSNAGDSTASPSSGGSFVVVEDANTASTAAAAEDKADVRADIGQDPPEPTLVA